ncbi:MAG: hypothetical protein K0S09_1358 [Sphingobacteriaceae bacterium]|jgi:hypothetical protein|nr:hypothetical protein [Sphingobacteriaceae bacterium]
MKKIYSLLKHALILAAVSSSLAASAQDEVGEFIKSSPADATKLANAYLTPLFKGFGVGLNSGWNNTANAKNLGRFELRLVSVSGAMPSEADKTFDITKIGLSNNVRPTNTSQTINPTVAGPDGGISVDIYNGSQKIETVALPGGADLPAIPSFNMLQGTVGLIKGIDVTLRLLPKIKAGDVGTFNMIGGGVKLELLPLIAGNKVGKLLPFDLAVALGYTQFGYQKDLNVQPESGAESDPAKPGQSQDFSNQRIDAKFTGINTEVILSKKFLIFTPFVSVGYNNAKTDAGLKGNYPVTTGALIPSGTRTYTTYTDPVSINQTDISGFRGNVGFQLNLAFLRLYGSYSLAEYNAFNVGLGIGIGK